MGYLVGPAVLWPREGILETRLVSSQTFYAAPGFGVWYSGFSYDHKRVRVLERPISPEKTRLTKNFRRWPWCSNAWRDSGRAYPLLRRQNRALLSEWPNLIALNFAFFLIVVSLVLRRFRLGQSWTLPWAVTSPRKTRPLFPRLRADKWTTKQENA